MPANVIIVHGAYGHPRENWFDWLRGKLQENHIPCLVPALPTPEGQSLDSWLKTFSDNCLSHIHHETILIGHSLGAAFILRWLERTQQRVKAVFLAGVFTGTVGNEKFDDINRDFFVQPFAWDQIRKKSDYFACYHGDNDPYVTNDNFHFISDQLKARKIVIAGGGHLNSAAGYGSFPLLFSDVTCLIS